MRGFGDSDVVMEQGYSYIYPKEPTEKYLGGGFEPFFVFKPT